MIKQKTLKKKRLTISIALSLIISLTAIVYAGTHSGHYDKYFFYEKWSYTGLDIHIKYYYIQDGKNYFAYRASQAANAWTSFSYSPFDTITQTTDWNSANMAIRSKDYGNIGWYGKCYYTEYPKRILVNEYYMNSGYTGATFERYAEVISHEMGHAHGLDHYECTGEVMVGETGWKGNHYPGEGDIRGIYDIY